VREIRGFGLVAPGPAAAVPNKHQRIGPRFYRRRHPVLVTVRRFPRWGCHPGRGQRRVVRTSPEPDRLPTGSRSGRAATVSAHARGTRRIIRDIRSWATCPSGRHRDPISVTVSQLVRAPGDRTSRPWQGRWWCRRHDTTVCGSTGLLAVTTTMPAVSGLSAAGSGAPTQFPHIQFLHPRRRRCGRGTPAKTCSSALPEPDRCALWADPKTSEKAGTRSPPPRQHGTCGR
jgi:hypothetical protein